MSDTVEVQDDLPGWLFSAARAACAVAFLDLAEAANVSTAWIQRIERLPVIGLRHARGRGAEGVDPAPLGRLLAVFRGHGLELRGAAGVHPAMLVCVDPVALEAIRAANGKSGAAPAEVGE